MHVVFRFLRLYEEVVSSLEEGILELCLCLETVPRFLSHFTLVENLVNGGADGAFIRDHLLCVMCVKKKVTCQIKSDHT